MPVFTISRAIRRVHNFDTALGYVAEFGNNALLCNDTRLVFDGESVSLRLRVREGEQDILKWYEDGRITATLHRTTTFGKMRRRLQQFGVRLSHNGVRWRIRGAYGWQTAEWNEEVLTQGATEVVTPPRRAPRRDPEGVPGLQFFARYIPASWYSSTGTGWGYRVEDYPFPSCVPTYEIGDFEPSSGLSWEIVWQRQHQHAQEPVGHIVLTGTIIPAPEARGEVSSGQVGLVDLTTILQNMRPNEDTPF
jgi:hypothetical protein